MLRFDSSQLEQLTKIVQQHGLNFSSADQNQQTIIELASQKKKKDSKNFKN